MASSLGPGLGFVVQLVPDLSEESEWLVWRNGMVEPIRWGFCGLFGGFSEYHYALGAADSVH